MQFATFIRDLIHLSCKWGNTNLLYSQIITIITLLES